MTEKELKKIWVAEEEQAHIYGWDFSHIKNRYKNHPLPWDYEKIVRSYLTPDKKLLDIDTGGGEFLLSLNHPANNTSATEGYMPNVELCKKKLIPLGIDFKKVTDYSNLPFCDNKFDIVINRHGNYDVSELYRVLKPNGIFITEQVGEDNERDLVELLLPGTPKQFHGLNLADQQKAFRSAGFMISYAYEAFPPIEFFDIGALVWFAKIIEWEFCGFSVEKCFDRLLKLQQILNAEGSIKGTAHRYIIVASKRSDIF